MTPLHHEFIEGKDGIKRCEFCHITKMKRGKVIPNSVPCPTRTKSGVEPCWTDPVTAEIMDILGTPCETPELRELEIELAR